MPDDVCMFAAWLRSELETEGEAAGLGVGVVVWDVGKTSCW